MSLEADRARLRDPDLSSADLFAIGSRHLHAHDDATVRFAIVGNLTIDALARAVACSLVRDGERPCMYLGAHGAYVQELSDDASALYAFEPDAVLLALDWRPFAERDDAVTFVARLWERLEARGIAIYQHLPEDPPERLRGIAECYDAASPRHRVATARERLLALGAGRVRFIDTAWLAARIGSAAWAPPRYRHTAQLPFDPKHLPAYMRLFAAARRDARGTAKRVLALDLDNTLWGGAIGDDGVEGIELGAGTPRGEAFADWQRYVLALRARGVLLAVCSKNDPALAVEGFAHRQSLLKREDFAAFVCTWNDKAAALRAIAAELGLALETIVFADDDPVECGLVCRLLPEVEVVELGRDPSRFPERLEMGFWFDTQRATDADALRARSYTARAALERAAASGDLAAYLAELDMVGRVFAPSDPDFARLAQLESKTNQFNLTQRRYSERDLRALRERAVMAACALRDRHTDHGVVSSLVAFVEGDALRIDSWVMSCRVFSRTLEAFMMNAVIDAARARGVRRIVGEYRAAARNGVVADLFTRLGFERSADDPTRFERALDAPTPPLPTFVRSAP